MIADHYLQLRTDLETALIRLLRLGADLQRGPGSLETLHALLTDIRQPLLFVAVGEVKAGFECGIGFERFNDLKVGDLIEVFTMERVAETA